MSIMTYQDVMIRDNFSVLFVTNNSRIKSSNLVVIWASHSDWGSADLPSSQGKGVGPVINPSFV